MKSKISFYSFKETETITARPFRKDNPSNFQQFEMLRREEQYRHNRKNKHFASPKQKKAKSQNILVKSQEEKELMSFLKVPNLPKIKMSTPRKMDAQTKAKISSCYYQKPSSLEKILGNKKKFMHKYFRSLKSFEQNQGIEDIKHIFDEVRTEGWGIVGYLKGSELIFKAKHTNGQERYFKYNYKKYISNIKTNYEAFVKEIAKEQLLNKYHT